MNIVAIHASAEALAQAIDLPVTVHQENNPNSNVGLMLEIDSVHQLPLVYLHSHNELEALESLLGANSILYATQLSATQVKQLKNKRIQYFDEAGNAFIRQPGLYVFVRGMRKADTQKQKPIQDARQKTGKAFQPNGLKVIYALLTDSQLVGASMRSLAEQAGVALGSVGAIIKDLVAHGFLTAHAANAKMINRERLIERWAELYPYSLRDKAHLGRFTTANRDWWEQLPRAGEYQLSGEIAAFKLTQYLNPKDGLVYVKPDDLSELLRAGRLRKLKEGEQPEFVVDIYEPFWKFESASHVAHELIVYSDLLSTNDPRNIDAARRLLDGLIY